MLELGEVNSFGSCPVFIDGTQVGIVSNYDADRFIFFPSGEISDVCILGLGETWREAFSNYLVNATFSKIKNFRSGSGR